MTTKDRKRVERRKTSLENLHLLYAIREFSCQFAKIITTFADQIDEIVNISGDDKQQIHKQRVDRVLTRRQVAKLLNVTPTSVSNYAKRGLIRRVAFGARGIRSNGYAESSVRELLQQGE